MGDIIGCSIDLATNDAFSEIRFFKNGKDQGQAYGFESKTVIPKGVYFPAVSVFGKVRKSVPPPHTHIVSDCGKRVLNFVNSFISVI